MPSSVEQFAYPNAAQILKDQKITLAGKPEVKTTVTVGRADLTQATGSVQEAVELVPRPDRDVVMVKLAQRVPESVAKPVKVAIKAPAEGEQLQVAGFGRPKTEWVPSKLHTSLFTVASTDPASVALHGSENAVICQGDVGAPAVRGTGDSAELVALNIRSWQGGCLGTDESEKRTSALDARLGNLAAWVSTVAFRDAAAAPAVTVAGDDNGDAVGSGSYSAPKKLTDGWNFTQTTTGDFTGDGKTDLTARTASGDLRLWVGNGNGTFGGATAPGQWHPYRPISALAGA
ncbi:trypsin-like serine protease [Streptomyces sp. CBMA152]|uniref:trypsin-like serine protease n=1 Tax=Streptomyces sp. CBMA152 TaxID=1896312 RepID=UPI001660FC17|nr:trypsin-like serine protease [Streptomyces sp. CBMA152]MBD0744929.1 hypothetical protein [Streptomyces sp. CBMA152]